MKVNGSMKENNIARIGCGIFLLYLAILFGALIHIVLMHVEPSSWFEVKPKTKTEIVQENCDSLLRVKCDSLGIDYNTIGTTTDPD
jgi:hypothetical protein